MTFKVGDRVMYPHNGAGEIVSIIDKTRCGDEIKQFYVIEISHKKLKITIPVENAENLGIRKIISGKDIEKVLNILQSKPKKIANNSKQRKDGFNEKITVLNKMESYKAILKNGSIYDVAKLVRDLSFEKQSLQKQTSRLTRSKNVILNRAISDLKEELVMAGMEEESFIKMIVQINQNIKSIVRDKEGTQMCDIQPNVLAYLQKKYRNCKQL